ncbi:hypothetical protein [Blastopirellula marina]|uniref:Uncharacterized protein n=1 Tax=Blastopirellula marina TaxID=124 RepID=A0A2S8GRI6_9BACT|nr:hypothetical protein [Blastopirellula marina]PQO47035.1 hypothetical protein C5Y93_05960 [Blastopirellula marina]
MRSLGSAFAASAKEARDPANLAFMEFANMSTITKSLPLFLAAVILLASAGTTFAAKSAEPTCCAPEPPKPCCYEPCFRYKTHRLAKKACPCDCCGPTEAILQVTDPRCNCYVDVPVCIPSCCEGVPCIESRCGLFNRGIVEYEWCCGFKVKVVFKNHGKVDVHYYGL